MPWTYRFDPEREALFATATGILVEEEIKPALETVLQSPHFSATRRLFLDYSAITDIRLKIDTVRTLATNRIFAPSCRRALLVPSNLAFGMGRMYQIFSEGSGTGAVEVFRDRASAMAWLNEGVPMEKFIT